MNTVLFVNATIGFSSVNYQMSDYIFAKISVLHLLD